MLNPDFAEMLSALCAERVRFLLVGAYALGAHGLPRATGDIDIWIAPETDNAPRAMRALRRFGAPLFDLQESDLERPGTVFQMGLPPRRIDILTAIDGVEFEEAWAGRLTTRLGAFEVSVLGRKELIQNKRAAGRPKDLVDVLMLERSEPQLPTRPAKGKRPAPRPPRRKG